MARSFLPLDDTEKEAWLMQHVPHRVCAALAWLPMTEWGVSRPTDLPTRDFRVWCVDRSVEEGRKAAMRWLIEFIGITPGKNDEPIPTEPHTNGKSVTIAQVGGSMFDTKREEARKLAKISRACAQASMHPTAATNHHPLKEHDVVDALCIVIDHLETALYGPRGRDLRKIVREQEELAIARSRSGRPTNAPGL